ncbi:MAG: CoA transferase [Gammaproteobacteria bacterium]|nr:CoA transferase [Gammaproteobacteria bacterium]
MSAASDQTGTRPLDGVRVLEFATAIQGPAAGQFLADLGAEVIKVEPPLGDSSRNIGPVATSNMGSQFIAVNRGKRSICLDAHSATGRALLERLAAISDVFLTNFRGPALERMGLDDASLKQHNPTLIYAAASGFGPAGPDATKAMVDGAAQARGGLAGMTGNPDQRPTPPGAAIADTSGAMALTLGVVTALYERATKNVHRRVDSSALGAQLWLQMWELQHAALTGDVPVRSGSHHPNLMGPVGVYTTKDAIPYHFSLLLDPQAWQALWEFCGQPDVAFDPRWDHPSKQFNVAASEVAEIRELMQQGFATRTAAEWDAFLATQPRLICERVRTYSEVLEDDQNLANGYVSRITLTSEHTVQTVGLPVAFDSAPRTEFPAPPALGEATRETMLSLVFSAVDHEQLQSDVERARAIALGNVSNESETPK